MNKINTAFAFVLFSSLCGCATTGYNHASETSSAIGQTKTLAVKLQQNIDIAVTVLQSLTNQEAAIDLQQPYQKLTTVVNTLDGQVNDLPDHARVIKARGNAYVKDWQQELLTYQNSAIRARSAQRLSEVSEDFQKVNQQFDATSQTLRPLLMNLKDMRRYLETDLTSGGVANIQDQIGGVTNEAALVQQTLQSLLSELNRVDRELSPKLQAQAPEPLPASAIAK